MPVINAALVTRNALLKRDNWAAQNPGVTVVFAIVGVVAIALLYLFISKKMTARRERRERLAARGHR